MLPVLQQPGRAPGAKGKDSTGQRMSKVKSLPGGRDGAVLFWVSFSQQRPSQESISLPGTDSSCHLNSSGHLGFHRHDVEVHQVVEGQMKHVLICTNRGGSLLLSALAWSSAEGIYVPLCWDNSSGAARVPGWC